MRGLLVALAAVLAASFSTTGSARSFAPQNECRGLAGANDFRRVLTTAVVNRNEDMLLDLASPEVLLDFGGGSGRDLLRERLTDPEYKLWEELDKILRLGCASYDEGTIVLPWYFAQDLGTEDAYATLLVTGAGVPFYKDRDAASPMIDRLNWDVVTLLDEWSADPYALAHVALPSGRKGYVAWAKLRSQVDYRLLAERGEDGRFRITNLIAGD